MLQRTALGARTARAFPAGRRALGALFFANGFVLGSWAPKVPFFAERLGLSDFGLGLMILMLGIGSLTMMPLTGSLIARIGSARILRFTAMTTVPALLVLTLVTNVPSAAVAMFLVGATVGAMDIAMNANAIVVERRMKRAIMSSCHGFWSLGGLVGAVLGGVLIARFGALWHVVVVTLIEAAALASAWTMIATDGPQPDEARTPLAMPRSIVPYLIGIMALFAMVPEGAVLDWGAIYLRRALDANIVLSGLGFGAFSAAMALMRFAGDPVRDRLGAVKTMRLCAFAALVGMLCAGLAPNVAVAIAGFSLAGIGIANMVPIAFSAAGNMPGLAQGVALSLVTFMGYSGILFAPSLIGFAAEHVSFRLIYSCLAMLFLVVLALSSLARHADGGTQGN
ncbi:MFS transporter [Pararhizobium mangrovi]|uniref:MFS transporter n=1 Tax=Pararhizobium mangrovi TaxID=2590452 RepID=A0A506TY49_9HYPH|nr:MFS transporter [Pararhizobium mangrovi]TPW26992.1 MFS transporter [Pararhizobium mangrovi]